MHAFVVAREMLYCFWRGMYQDTAVKLKEDKVQPSRHLNRKHPVCSALTLLNINVLILLRSLGFEVSPESAPVSY
jgi:hypothetical protein